MNEAQHSPEGQPSFPQSAVAPTGWRRTFTAFSHRNYRLWFLGQLCSLLGTWMQATALGYLVYELTHSPSWLGYVGFAAGAPTWVFTLWAGVLSDRVARRSMLLATQTALMLCAAALALLVFTGAVRPWFLVLLSFAQGTANAFDAPARQAFVPELVDRRDLGNAIALNAMLFNSAVVLGPALGGLLYAALGPGWCFAVNAVSFFGVLGALLALRLRPPSPLPRQRSAFADLREGIVYVARHPSIRLILLLVAAVTVLGFAYVSLLPAFAVKILHGDARTNGLLQTARGVGALGGALYLASLGRQRRSGRLLAVGSLLLPVALLAFASARSVPMALGALSIVGLGLTLFYNNANTLVQTLSDDPLRGRVTGVYSLMMFGLLPFGSLVLGALAEHLGEPWTVGVSAAALLVCATLLHLAHPALRNVN